MSKGKNNHSESESSKAEEPETTFDTFHIFDSFEEAEEYTAKQRAALSYDERMTHIEELRKRVFSEYLLENGIWPSISKAFKVMEPYTNEAG